MKNITVFVLNDWGIYVVRNMHKEFKIVVTGDVFFQIIL